MTMANFDFIERRIIAELQRRSGGILTRDEVERAAQTGDSTAFDQAIDRLAAQGLLVVNKRGGQDMISLSLAGRSVRAAATEGEP